MDLVFLVVRTVRYEGSDVEKAFKSHQRAEQYADRMNRDGRTPVDVSYDVEILEVE